ncbi:polysaccharide pyruvyl transferase family protein [Nibricoccus sp. IMCC34717]|uniref:polysaccharide pyruvyl transferase family protein n=1 Tax=Nibricoccus sp. IMCC34717 TaxID=3034021 RepID=UPI00384DC852
MIEICLMGTPMTSGNRGVTALGISLLSLLSKSYKQPRFNLLLHQPNTYLPKSPLLDSLSLTVVNNRLSPKQPRSNLLLISLLCLIYRFIPSAILRSKLRNFCPWIAAVERSSFVVDIRGGDSFSDIYGFERYMVGHLMALTVVLLRKPLVLAPQTYGPFTHAYSKFTAPYILRNASIVFARDKISATVAKALVGNQKEIRLAPDVAFNLPVSIDKTVCHTIHDLRERGALLVGINVNALMLHGGYSGKNDFKLCLNYREYLTQVSAKLVNEYNATILFIPHTYASDIVEDDRQAINSHIASLPEQVRAKVSSIGGEYGPDQLKGFISQCDFFIGSRMHSCIAALSCRIPCVGVAYSMKFSGVFDSVEMSESVIDSRTLTTEQAINTTFALLEKRADLRSRLLKIIPPIESKLTSAFSNIVNCS